MLYREGLKQTGHSLVTKECQTDGLQDYDNLKQNVKDMVLFENFIIVCNNNKLVLFRLWN